MRRDADSAGFLASINEALAMLRDLPMPPGPNTDLSEPLPSLLQQCITFGQARPEREPVRTLHHFACSGGTLMARCIAAMPNCVLLSEIDPLSRFHVNPDAAQFTPTDILLHLRKSLRPVRDRTIERVFLAAVAALRDDLGDQGQRLILRDHAHSQFCTDADPDSRPTLRELIQRDFPVRSVLTVRHPLDSFLSLTALKWINFSPFTLNEYSRRYQDFLARHRDVPQIRYEDFVRKPDQVLEQICQILGLTYNAGATGLLSVVSLTGDSGRAGTRIEQRPRRNVPSDIHDQAANSPIFHALCREMGYDPDPDATDATE